MDFITVVESVYYAVRTVSL